MGVNLLEVGQFISILLAAGTPGMTYYVMGRMHKTQLAHLTENCTKCKAGLDEKIEGLDDTLDHVEERQKQLRERTLPDEFVKRRELDSLKLQHDKDVQEIKQQQEKEVDIIHKRIDRYHPPSQGGP